jgi:heptosyltransferase-1
MKKNILIIRLSAIGDVVMASPLIGACRRSMPESRLAWLVEEISQSVLEANPDLDEIIVWPRNKWRKLSRERRYWTLAKEFFGFVKQLRMKGFDLAIDAQGLLKSGLWAYLSGAPERVGIGSKEGSQHLMTRVVDRSGASDRTSSQYLLLAEALGLDVSDFRMTMALSRDAVEYANRFAASLDTLYMVFCPFTTRPQKHWMEERWIELLEVTTDKMDLTVVLLGGPGDRAASEKILPVEGQNRVNLTGKTTLQQAAAIMKQSALVIGVDTGLTHMGFALGVPTVALFGATRPYLNTEGMPGTVLYHPLECSPCRRSPTCESDYTCMKAISTDEVLSTAESLLKNEGGAP